ncbi:M23 family metallopeptidase [Clostridioides sp. ES-S-0145-01]|uniref:peptidoglycan DD-metalloendopeptidase family protein n=1 Tax=Clostridioides sp. ES-S-0145-01 TaxID=2770784 RepID=UPI001D1259DB|nr:M23 family metallopeptidase [Clostridioides sp. ES-S-0145-01]
MKKKLLEKDGFYLSLFVCVCLLAVGGVWFTNNNVDKLASNKGMIEKSNKDSEEEIHLIEKDKKDAIPTATDSKQNLEKAKAKEENKSSTTKLNYIGDKIIREYSEKEPSYSKTLDVWETHKGIDVSCTKGKEIKSLLNGMVVDVFDDEEYGKSVKIKSDNNTVVVYSNLDENVSVKKNQKVTEGQSLGTVGSTSQIESEEGIHVHLEAYNGEKSMDPMSLIK